MSVEAMTWVFNHSPYKLATRLVHLALADWANDGHDWLVWASQPKIATKARVSTSTVAGALAQMVGDGYLEVVEERPGQPTLYRFLRPTPTESTGVQPPQSTGSTPPETTGVPPQSTKSDLLLTEEKQKKNRRATRCPEPFTVTAPMHDWITSHFPAVDWRAETEKFVDYWRGNGKTKVDWVATWRNWMRRAAEYGGSNGTGGRPRESAGLAARRRLHDRLREGEPDESTRGGPAPGLHRGGVAELPLASG